MSEEEIKPGNKIYKPKQPGKLFILIVCVLLLLGHYWNIYKFIFRADAYAISKNPKEELKALRMYLKYYPDDKDVRSRYESVLKTYKNRFLKEAEIKLKHGDMEGAISAYHADLNHYPSDFNVVQKLADLYDKAGDYVQAEWEYRQVISHVKYHVKNPGPIIKNAKNRLFYVDNALSSELNDRADKQISNNKLNDALKTLNTEIKIILRGPFMYRFGNPDNINKHKERVVRNNFDTAIAKIIYVDWRIDKKKDVNSDLYDYMQFNRLLRDVSVSYVARCEIFTKEVWDYANRLYNQKKWDMAAVSYYDANKCMQNNRNDEYRDYFISNLSYVQAKSEYNAENYWSAYIILKGIQYTYPGFREKEVSNLIKAARQDTRVDEAQKLWDNAYQSSNKKQWAAAEEDYNKILKYFDKNGYRDKTPFIGHAYSIEIRKYRSYAHRKEIEKRIQQFRKNHKVRYE